MSNIHVSAQNIHNGLLKFLTCGSVDDGKSTLIGRLLYESNLVYDDQIEALKKDSLKKGMKEDEGLDFSLLLDGLKAEREQSITIDVAYRYFATNKRKFIIADCPGHVQYTRNMVTGATHADAAIILIDASKGMKSQTRRHAYIISLLGIKHVILAVNKMDLIGYNEDKFKAITDEFIYFSKHLGFDDLKIIPLCAIADSAGDGGNLVTKSDKMPFYDGPTLLEALENMDIGNRFNLNDFRFNVLYVNRPNCDFRGYSGSIASGIVHVGDEVVVLPSGLKTKIKGIVTANGDLSVATVPQTVCLTLQDELDVSAGDMIVAAKRIPQCANQFYAYLIWMDTQNLNLGKKYVMRIGAREVKAFVKEITYVLDVDTMTIDAGKPVESNSIAKVVVETVSDIYFDSFTSNPALGRFILIDTLTNATVAGGMILQTAQEPFQKENVFHQFWK